MISKLEKLKGRSFAEFLDRARQKAAALAERSGVGMPPDAIFDCWNDTADTVGAFDLAKAFGRSAPTLWPVFDSRDEPVAAFRRRFPAEAEMIIARADRAAGGEFDLLGYSGLRFGRASVPDWHLDPVSGRRSPLVHWSRIEEVDAAETGDKKIVWELNRHQYFTVLGRAYWLTGDEKYADVFVSHLEDWIDSNPPKLGVNWLSSLEVAFRSISWIWAYYFFRESGRMGSDLLARLLKLLYLNARHIETHLSTYSSPNTHLTGEALGLYLIGRFLSPAAGSERWRKKGREILLGAIEWQIRGDGGYVEQATLYHRYTADIYLAFQALSEGEGAALGEPFESRLSATLRFLMHLTQPNGETPLIGDDDGGRLHFPDGENFADFRSTLALGAIQLRDPRLKAAAGAAGPEMFWLSGPRGLEQYDSLPPVEPSDLVAAFEETGWYVIRDNWTPASNFVLVDCGEHGFMNGGHAHADALSFVLSVNGEPVFVDSGTFTYTADPAARDYFRSTSAHNCLTVAGESSSVPNGPFSWASKAPSKVLEWKTDAGETVLRAAHDGFERFGVGYEREFRVTPSGMLLVDKIAARSARDFELSFIMAPSTEARAVSGGRVEIVSKDGKRPLLTIVTKLIGEVPGASGEWRIEHAEISPRYGQKVPTARLVYAVSRPDAFRIENSIVFAGKAR